MVKSFLLILLLVACTAYASQRTEKIQALMKAQGMLQLWQQQIDDQKIQGRKHAKEILNTVLAQMSPTKEYKKRFEQAYMKFIDSVQGHWTAKKIVDVWARYYGTQFTNEELDQMLAYYTSDVGQKDVVATQSASKKFSAYFQKANKPIIEKALREYIHELKQVVKQCDCRKK